jgi:cysteinyl-tRNA synthetase
VFPHHENELAQAESCTGKPFAKYWIHHGLLTINSQKMSKSLGNFITVKKFIDEYQDADLLKLFFLSAHYSHPIDYNEAKIEETIKQKSAFNTFFDKVNFWPLISLEKKVPFSDKDKQKIDQIELKFEEAMNDDFNTPMALASLFMLIDMGSKFISSDSDDAFMYVKKKVETYFDILGLEVKQKITLPKEALELIYKRQLERAKKNFEGADGIRKLVEEQYKILISDTVSSATASAISIKPLKSNEGNKNEG